MRIIFFIHGLTGGGSERVLVTLANGFVSRGETVCVCCTNEDTESIFPLDKRVEVKYISHIIPPKTNPVLRKIKTFLTYRNIVKRYKADVVISFNVQLNIKMVKTMMGIEVPLICCEHTTLVRNISKELIRGRKLYYPLSDVVTVLTHADYGMVRKKCNTVRMPNPYVPCIYDKGEDRKKVILAAGRLNRWSVKGYDNLLKSWDKLWKDYPDWKLQIAGGYTAQDIAPLMEIVDNLGLNNVEFLGYRKDLNVLMLKSEIFCLSSRVEGLPMVLLEAMNAGCACIANDCKTGPSEIIIDGVNGLLAKYCDTDDMALKLRSVMESEKLREMYRKNVYLSLQRYTLDKVIQRWYILFKKMGIDKTSRE